jgi:hypothetical protein
MSLSDLASLGSFVSGLAVLISLVYLALQIRQAERNQVASIKQGRTNRIISTHLPRLDPSTAMAINKGMTGAEDITDQQLEQFRAWVVIIVSSAEDSFSQHAAGLLDEASYSGFVAQSKGLLGMPGYRAVWKQVRDNWPNEFGSFYDGLISEAPLSTAWAHFNRDWRKTVAAEKSRTQ